MGKIERRLLIKKIAGMDSVESVERIGEGFIIHYKEEEKNG